MFCHPSCVVNNPALVFGCLHILKLPHCPRSLRSSAHEQSESALRQLDTRPESLKHHLGLNYSLCQRVSPGLLLFSFFPFFFDPGADGPLLPLTRSKGAKRRAPAHLEEMKTCLLPFTFDRWKDGWSEDCL